MKKEESNKEESKKLLQAFVVPVVLLILMWSSYFLEVKGWISIRQWGIRPLELKGLLGIFLTPFLHGSTEHLFNNSIPLLVLGGALFYFYREVALKTLAWIVLMGGFWVWVSARPGTNHIGMSGVVYGLVAFIFFSGILRKHTGMIALSMLMIFLYGSLIWGVFPIKEGVSWEGHLWGAVSGGILAWYFQYEGVQRKVYQWELDEIAEQEELERLRNLPPDFENTHMTTDNWEITYEWKEASPSEPNTEPNTDQNTE